MQRSTIWSQFKIPVASIVWLVSMIAIIMGTYQEVSTEIYAVFALVVLLFFSGSDRLAFFYFIILTVGVVFLFLVLAFRDKWSPLDQGVAIGFHFLFLVHLFALYSLAKYVYQFRSENYFLRDRILRLEGFISEEGILSSLEFEKQAAIILGAMARRNEIGYYAEIDLSELPRSTKRTAAASVGSILRMTIRNHYDIVGKTGDNVLAVLLQNTGTEGVNIVKSRIDERLKDTFEEQTIEKMKWTIKRIEGQTSLHEEAGS